MKLIFRYDKRRRLLKKQSFSLVFAEKDQKYFYENFLILTKKNYLTNPRLGIIIPKRLVKKAVDRNLFKRKIRESFRINQVGLENIDIIFLLTKKFKQDQAKKQTQIKQINFNNFWLKLKK